MLHQPISRFHTTFINFLLTFFFIFLSSENIVLEVCVGGRSDAFSRGGYYVGGTANAFHMLNILQVFAFYFGINDINIEIQMHKVKMLC